MGIYINIAKEFSLEPYGRFLSDGEFSGERFREEKLIPALETNESVEVQLGGTDHYGAVFMEEAFGGLVRAGYSGQFLRERLRIHHEKLPSIEESAWFYIDRARAKLEA